MYADGTKLRTWATSSIKHLWRYSTTQLIIKIKIHALLSHRQLVFFLWWEHIIIICKHRISQYLMIRKHHSHNKVDEWVDRFTIYALCPQATACLPQLTNHTIMSFKSIQPCHIYWTSGDNAQQRPRSYVNIAHNTNITPITPNSTLSFINLLVIKI